MSMTGYCPAGSDIRLTSLIGNEVDLVVPRENVVKYVSLSKLNNKTSWVEVAAPFIIHNQLQKLEYRINTVPFKTKLPGTKPLEKLNISPVIFQKAMRSEDSDGDIIEGVETNCNEWKIKRSEKTPTFKIEKEEIIGTTFFIINDFITTRNKSLLYVGLMIENICLRYLIYDLAVFTNTIQLVDNRPAAGKNVLEQKVFWWSEEIFVEKKVKRPPKKEKVEVEELVTYADVTEKGTKKRLRLICEATSKSLESMKKLLSSKEEPTEGQISAIGLNHLTSFLPLFEDKKAIIPKEYVLIELPPPPPPLPDFLELGM